MSGQVADLVESTQLLWLMMHDAEQVWKYLSLSSMYFWIVCTRWGNIRFVLFLVPWSCRKPFALPVPKKWRLGRFAFDFDPIVEHWPRDSFTGHRKSRPSVVDGRLLCTQPGRQLHGWRDDIVIEDCLLCLFVGWLVGFSYFWSFFLLSIEIVYICGYNVTHSLLYNLPILFKILSICADLFNFPSESVMWAYFRYCLFFSSLHISLALKFICEEKSLILKVFTSVV